MRKAWKERDGQTWYHNPWDWIDYGFRYHRRKIETAVSVAASIAGVLIAVYFIR